MDKRKLNNFKSFSCLALVTGGVLCLSSNSSMPKAISNDKISISQNVLDLYNGGSESYILSENYTLMDKFNEFYDKKVSSDVDESLDVITTSLDTTLSTTSTTISTTTALEPAMTLDTTISDEDYSQCMYMKSKYFYVDSFESYTVVAEDMNLEDICSKIGTSSVYDIWDYLPYTVDIGDTLSYPIKYEYYKASKGEKIEDIAFLNGLDESVIRGLNNIPSDVISFDFDTNILLHVFKGKSTSYETRKGISNVINNNKIFADKIVSVGENGNEKVLGLLNENYIYGANYVNLYKFDGNGNYSTKSVCSNVMDIDVVDGELASYIRDEDYARCMAINCGISNPDDFSISQFKTNYNYSYDIYVDCFCASYIKCDEGRQFVR